MPAREQDREKTGGSSGSARSTPDANSSSASSAGQADEEGLALWLGGRSRDEVVRDRLSAFGRKPERVPAEGAAGLAEHAELLRPYLPRMDRRHWLRRSRGVDPPVDLKLVQDSYVWRRILEETGLRTGGSLLELLPGFSRTVPFALCGAGVDCRLTRIDRDTSWAAPRSAGDKVALRLLELDLFSPEHSWAGYDFVVGNHVLDDLIIAAWDDRRYRLSFGRAEESALLWRDFRSCGESARVIAEVTDLFARLIRTMDPGAVLVLREYPATFALVNGIREQMELHWRIYRAVAGLVASLPGTAWEQDVSALPVADGSRLTGGVLCFRSGPAPAG
ncbi:hypothetical protein ACIGFK_26485 [Streptomyces sp. NPDC085524]|uniref:hypothetical protein n=1 Tax=unclassified Streptomyces TaxID=2593676 RepID=UPI0035E34BF9